MSTHHIILDGQTYLRNAKGGLDPIETIREIDIARDEVVRELAKIAENVNKTLAEFKKTALETIAAFVSLAADQHGVTLGGEKGNVTLRAYDGSLSIQRDISELITFDEGLQIAKQLIDECMREWTKNAGPELRAIVDEAFQVDKQGKISTTRVLGLRRLDIKDVKWKKAMDVISDSVTITGTRAYIRVYKRNGDTEHQIPLDLANA